jgi:outer membrane protein OmpA-like peptidoglycan-associated protein
MKTAKLTLLIAAACITMAGCNSTPKSNATLDAAQANYAAAQADPSVQKYAPIELKDAGDALAKAEHALKEREKPAVVEHLAYLAKQRVAITQNLAQLKTAEESVKTATADRDKVLLQARTAEADRLRNELNAKQTDRGLTISLGDVLFDTNKAQLKSGGSRVTQKIAKFLEENPQRNISIEGFTDSTGSDEHNQTLSERRAEAVKAALVDQGVTPDRIVSHGYGEAYPVADNNTSAGRQLNRRVDVVISDAGKSIAPR